MDTAKTVAKELTNEAKREKVRVIPIQFFDDFPKHPFNVKMDAEMEALIESIKEFGILTPLIARRKEDGRYEIIAGHRRKFAAKKLGLTELPVILREMTRDEAVIAMVDSNLHRERILPSERAYAYKMKMDARKRQGKRTDLTFTPVVSKLNSYEALAQENGESREQVRRYIRLTYLIKELLDLVDGERIALRPAVELSYLSVREQKDLFETIDSEDATPSHAQAIKMKKLSQQGKLTMDTIFSIMTQQKPNQIEKVKISYSKFEKYFSRGTPQAHIEAIIFKALDEYYAKRKK
ncbi:MAG: ParB/RepB/Spo0J family partition protein [Clostridia bacterium]|nr:ParB/RepB/Spo0J family partition protein [Clostridia bacterium]